MSSDARRMFLDTLDDLREATEANIDRSKLIQARIDDLKEQVGAGGNLVDVLMSEPSPLTVELITENINALQELGARLRWSEAALLSADGMTLAEIGRLFGVSRQRVSALVNSPPAAVDG